jgi:hypothetical protein
MFGTLGIITLDQSTTEFPSLINVGYFFTLSSFRMWFAPPTFSETYTFFTNTFASPNFMSS